MLEAFKEDNPHLIINKSLEEEFNQTEIEELYNRIFELKDKLYREEDINDELVQQLLHTHITLGEVENIFHDKTIWYKYGKDLLRIINKEETYTERDYERLCENE